MKNLVMFLTALFLSCGLLMAQQRTVTGLVQDAADGSGMPGANVVVKGTTTGTMTTVNGTFTLKVSGEKPVLTISSLGYKTVEVALKPDQTNVMIQLEEDTQVLNDVVVVGYGTMKKSDLSGASVSVGEEKLKNTVIANLDQALQGRAAGVSAVSTSGAPGGSVSIRVRGQSTINAGAEPLYVVDGVILQGNGKSGADFGLGDALGNGSVSTISPLSSINPSDILSMEILKDASATAIYGAQGANGVVLITTKKGKAGQAKFSYDGTFGVQQQVGRIDMMNLKQFAEYNLALTSETNGQVDRDEFKDPSLLGNGTDWQDAIYRDALTQSHQISAMGGTDKAKYYISGSYMNQEGTIIGTQFDRYSFRCNLETELKSWLKVGVNTMYSRTKEDLGLADSSEGIVNFSLLTPPDIPIYDVDGNYASVVREGYTRINPIAMALDNTILLKRTKLAGNIYADVNIYKGLTWHTELGYDISGSKGEVFIPAVKYGNYTRAINSDRVQKNDNTFWQVKNYVTYTKDIDKHNFTIMAGQECWESEYDFESMTTTNLPSNDIHNPSLGSDPQISSGFGSSAMASFFGRATYNYDDRYMGTYTYRQDGSSNFGPNKRWADFHSFAGSWRFSNEEFFESLKGVISNGKLRLGWGQTGNSDISGYRWGASIVRMDSGLGTGYRQSNIANPSIKWETQEQYNIGLDLGFFDDRINLVIDAYQKTSKDMLMQLQLPSYMGTRGNQSSALAAPWGNYGEIENKGLEITLNTKNLTGDFKWDSEFQISFNKNELTALDGTDAVAIEGYGQWSDVVSLSQIGKSLYNFYGYKTDGVYKDLADLQNSPKPEKYPSDGVSFNRANTTWVGDLKFKDISGPDGKPDGVVNTYDRTVIGNPFPDFTFGFTNTFSYKNFDLSIFINGSYGNDVMNYMAINLSNMKSSWDNQLSDVTNRAKIVAIDGNKTYANGANWYDDITNIQVSNPNTKTPRAIANDPNDNDRISDRYIEDGSYIRIKNITLGYNVPSKYTRKLKIDNLRIRASIDNLYTFTDYSGYDPEVGASTASTNVYGLDNGRYPSPRIYSFGLSLSF